MARKRSDTLQDLVWRLKSLPRRLRGEVPGASKAEALEDVLLLGTFVVGALIFLVFVASTFGGSSSPTYAAAPRDRPAQHASYSSGPKDLRPVKGYGHNSASGGAATSSGGGGSGGSRGAGGGGAQPACDPDLPETVRTRAGFRMFSFWRDRGSDLPSCQTTDVGAPWGSAQRR